jgi:hydroxyethylthiazole kinase-like uncharacterized protein yjeF
MKRPDLYFATANEMSKLDDLAVSSGLEIRQMMELAGWHMLAVFSQLKIAKSEKVTVVVGKGNKGGDGLCAARHLINNGWQVDIILMNQKVSSDSFHHLKLLQQMKAPIYVWRDQRTSSSSSIENSDLVVDALIGYRLKGAPRGDYGDIVGEISKLDLKVISYDIPTGIDATTGVCFGPHIKANATLTLGLPKRAFKKVKAKKDSGKIFLANIGIPAFLYNKVANNSKPEFGGFGGLIEI